MIKGSFVMVFFLLTEINHCLSQPCIFGTCTSELCGYKCACLTGYKGTNCDQGRYNVMEIPFHVLYIYFIIITYPLTCLSALLYGILNAVRASLNQKSDLYIILLDNVACS